MFGIAQHVMLWRARRMNELMDQGMSKSWAFALVMTEWSR